MKAICSSFMGVLSDQAYLFNAAALRFRREQSNFLGRDKPTTRNDPNSLASPNKRHASKSSESSNDETC
jgi:hypothetical protein